jgi:hypothetical protein
MDNLLYNSYTRFKERFMDPATLAAAASTVLAPYLAKTGEAMAEKIGEPLPAHAGRLWTTLTDKGNIVIGSQNSVNSPNKKNQ